MDKFISQKFKFFSFISMLLLVFVHGYNLNDSYLQPFTIVKEQISITTFTEYWLANGLFRFRIPMLFIISGYLFALNDYRPYKQTINKRLKTLGIPYLFWSAFALLLTFVFQQLPILSDAVYNAQIDQLGENKPYTEIGISGLLFRWLLAPTAFQLWFIRSLLIYNLFYPLIQKAVVRFPKIWFPVIGFFWLTTSGLIIFEGEGLLFFSLGIFLQKINFNIQEAPHWLKPKIWFPVFIMSSLVKSILAFYMDWDAASFIVLSILHKLTVFSGLVAMWYGIDRMVAWCMAQKWFTWLSAFAFIIYAIHVPLINYLTQIGVKYFHFIQHYRLLLFLILPLLIITICIIAGALLRAIAPKVYSLATGGRGL